MNNETPQPETPQTGDIVWHVFPLALAQTNGESRIFARFLGTAFFTGDRGYALTAAHIIPSEVPSDHVLVAMFNADGAWQTYDLDGQPDRHPTHDLALVKVTGAFWKTFLLLDSSWQGSSCRYSSWGYPEDVANEIEVAGQVSPRPDLVYTSGYIRRRVTDVQIPAICGTALFELSEVAGGGCSGSPVIRQPRPGESQSHWNVIGVYVGERIRAEEATAVGYALRLADLRGWTPSGLGHSLLDESERMRADLGRLPW
jgi:hypothetical protein